MPGGSKAYSRKFQPSLRKSAGQKSITKHGMRRETGHADEEEREHGNPSGIRGMIPGTPSGHAHDLERPSLGAGTADVHHGSASRGIRASGRTRRLRG